MVLFRAAAIRWHSAFQVQLAPWSQGLRHTDTVSKRTPPTPCLPPVRVPHDGHLQFRKRAPRPCRRDGVWLRPLATADWTRRRHLTRAGPIGFSPGFPGAPILPSGCGPWGYPPGQVGDRRIWEASTAAMTRGLSVSTWGT